MSENHPFSHRSVGIKTTGEFTAPSYASPESEEEEEEGEGPQYSVADLARVYKVDVRSLKRRLLNQIGTRGELIQRDMIVPTKQGVQRMKWEERALSADQLPWAHKVAADLRRLSQSRSKPARTIVSARKPTPEARKPEEWPSFEDEEPLFKDKGS